MKKKGRNYNNIFKGRTLNTLIREGRNGNLPLLLNGSPTTRELAHEVVHHRRHARAQQRADQINADDQGRRTSARRHRNRLRTDEIRPREEQIIVHPPSRMHAEARTEIT